MESFSSEIGKKMRSAVKAKLIELGTEGSTGYVDEELPDYVMIMVANKRSKQQMTSDLTLFLGTKTELFVTWLHEVLQKLQEVTVPAPVAAKKRKSSTKDESSSKKDKKSAKKEKKGLKHASTTEKASTSTTENNATTSTTTSTIVPVLPTGGSIRDVFAEDLLEKAKHSLAVNADAAANIKKAKSMSNKESTNEFDIPTISEISSSTSTNSKLVISGNRSKDLAELAEIQKKIYAAKKHLKELGELKVCESEDEDLLKLRHEGSSDSLSGENVENNHARTERIEVNNKAKSPIVFDKGREATPDRTPPPLSRNTRLNSPQPLSSAAVKTTNIRNNSTERRPTTLQHGPNEPPMRGRERERRESSPPQINKRPVHERLGIKPNNQSQDRRTVVRREKELYVPAHRRQDSSGGNDREPPRWRSRERDDRLERRPERDDNKRNERQDSSRRNERDIHKERVPVERDIRRTLQSRDASKSDEDHDDIDTISPKRGAVTATSLRHRVISQVIVAPVKPAVESSSEDEGNDKNVNSVIKIKPRPPVSPSRQACKNLLLKAVADAQRSTILSKSKATTQNETTKSSVGKVKARLGRTISTTENEEFFTKDLRERRLKRSATSSVTSSMLFRRQAENFIIEVEGNMKSKRLRRGNSEESIQSAEDEPYKPEPVSGGDRLSTMLSVSYKPHTEENMIYDEGNDEDAYNSADEDLAKTALQKTQFVVTLNEEKSAQKLKRLRQIPQHSHSGSRSISPQPQVSSSSTITRHNSNEPTSTTQTFDRSRSRETRRSDIRSRLAKNKLRPATPLSPSRAARLLRERESANSTPSSTNTPPRHQQHQQQQQRQRRGGSYALDSNYQRPQQTKDVKKIIIKNDTDDDASEASPRKRTPEKERKQHVRESSRENERKRSTEPKSPPPLPMQKTTTTKSSSSDRDRNENHTTTSGERNETASRSSSAKIRHHIPIKFDLQRSSEHHDVRSSRSKSREHSLDRRGDNGGEERRKISIRGEINNKYDNIPSLSSVALDSAVMRVIKPKERCKYHPNCTKQFCDFYHPTAPCKAFPNCKYADKCMYSHPNCKYDMACTNLDCNYSHSGVRNPSQLQPTAPPLSSHVVPVQNYKTISATTAGGASTATCKYYPNCTKVGCTFYHPKPCKFGKNCINKLECNFYHHELQSKFKWVASAN